MITSLSEISTVDATFAEDVEAYAAAGFDAIGLWEFKLPEDDEANIALLREHGLAVAVCVPAVPSVLPLAIAGMEGPADVEERIRSLEASVSRFAAYEPECVACLVRAARRADGGRGDGARSWTASGGIGAAAADAGVRVGFEPIHASQRDEAGFVNSLAHADEVFAEVDAPAIGHPLRHLPPLGRPGCASVDRGQRRPHRRRPRRRLAVARPQRPRSPRGGHLRRPHASSRPSRAAGWDGALDVEIFSTPELFWGLPVDEAARRAHDAASLCFRRARRRGHPARARDERAQGFVLNQHKARRRRPAGELPARSSRRAATGGGTRRRDGR